MTQLEFRSLELEYPAELCEACDANQIMQSKHRKSSQSPSVDGALKSQCSSDVSFLT